MQQKAFKVSDLRDSDRSINKTLMWGIIAGILGILTLGASAAMFKILTKNKKIK